MKFSHVIFYCKNWYRKRPGGYNTMWMDMAHCINAEDGLVTTENEVARWCLRKLDQFNDDPLFKGKSELKLHSVYHKVNDILQDNAGMSMDTAIILIFRDIISAFCPSESFDSGVKPNRHVLPLNYQQAWYDDGKYTKRPQWYPGDMDSDYQERVNNMFPEYRDQDIDENTFEIVEQWLNIKNINDVVVIIGTDSLLDCVELTVTGKQIISGKLNKIDDIDLNIYRHCDFDPEKKYIIRATKRKYEYVEGSIYTIKSMREA